MRKYRAILIQDINEYLLMMRQFLGVLFQEHHAQAGLTEDDVIKWIIEEELEQNYYLFTHRHVHNHVAYSTFYSQIKLMSAVPIEEYTSHYIKSPKLYGDDTVVDIKIKGRDLYIYYSTTGQFLNPFNKF